MIKNDDNLFKQLFLMHLDEVLCKISIVDCSYKRINWINN
jgi:hypothetical protein